MKFNEFQIIFFTAKMKFNWTILATDYENYMINFNCVNIDGQKSLHYAWLAGRSTQLNDTVKKEVDVLIDKYFVREAFFGIYQHQDFCEPRVI